MVTWDDGPLPKLDDLYSGIYIREGSHAAYEQLADEIVETLRPQNLSAGKPQSAARSRAPAG
jgi:hypothetical protein